MKAQEPHGASPPPPGRVDADAQVPGDRSSTADPITEPAAGSAVGDPADTAWTPPAPATPPAGTAGVVRRTRISGTWVAVVIAAIVLVFLLVFILQNQDHATVRFLGFSGTLPLGVALLFATIAGALLIALIGTARILQLRRRVRRLDH